MKPVSTSYYTQIASRAEVMLRSRYGGDFTVVGIGGVVDVGGGESARLLWCVEEETRLNFKAFWRAESESLKTELAERIVGDHLGSLLGEELSQAGVGCATWSKAYALGDVEMSLDELRDARVCASLLLTRAPLSATTTLYLPYDADLTATSKVIARRLGEFNASYPDDRWHLIVEFFDPVSFDGLKEDLAHSPDGEIVQHGADTYYMAELYASREGYARLCSGENPDAQTVADALEVMAHGE